MITGKFKINGITFHAEDVSIIMETGPVASSYKGELYTFPTQTTVDVKATVSELIVLTKDKYEELLGEPAQLRREIERLNNRIQGTRYFIKNALDIVDES